MKISRLLVALGLSVGVAVPLPGQGGPFGGEINGLTVVRTQPNVIFAATGGGVFRSTDGGRSWSDRSAGLAAVEVLDVDGPSWLLYAGLRGGEGVWRSINGGLWAQTTDVFGGNDVLSVAVKPDDPLTLLASTADGIFRSTDGGESWTSPVAPQDAAITDIVFSPADANRVVAVGEQRILESTDAGASWTGFSVFAVVRRITFDPGVPERYYATSDAGILVRESPASQPELLGGFGAFGESLWSLIVDPRDSDRLYALSDNFGLWRSENRGGLWTNHQDAGLPFGFSFAAATAGRESDRLLLGFSGTGVFASEDQGMSWTLSSDGLRASTVRAMEISPTDDRSVWVALNSGGLFRSTDGGDRWSESRTGFENTGSVVFEADPQDPNNLYVGGVDPRDGTVGSLSRSTDGGDTWIRVPGFRDYRALAVDPANSQAVLAGGTANFFLGRHGFIRSEDGAESFLLIPQSFSQFYDVVDLEFAPSDPLRVWALAHLSGAWSVWFSGDGGFFFAGPGLESGTQLLDLEVDPTSPERVYITTNGFGLLRTFPGQTSFVAANEGLPNGGAIVGRSIAIFRNQPSNLLVATDVGVFRSEDFGASWQPASTGLPARGVRQVIAGEDVAYAATINSGVYVSDDLGLTWRATARSALEAAGVVHGANFRAGAVAPAQIVSVFGGPFTGSVEIAAAQPLPTELAGVTVDVKDAAGVVRAAALFFVSPGQINIEIPPHSAPGEGSLTVRFNDGSEHSVPLTIASVSPGLFASAGAGEGPAAAVGVRVAADLTQTGFAVTEFVDGAHRTIPIGVEPGLGKAVILLFGTGIRGFSSIKAFVDGVEVPVEDAVAQSEFVGLDQVNIRLPSELAGRGIVEVYLFIDGVRTNSVTIEIL